MSRVALFLTIVVIGVSAASAADKVLTIGYPTFNPAPICEEVCPSSYDSVCASDGSCLKVFSNHCFMKAYNCRSQFDRPFLEVDFSQCALKELEFCF